MERCDAPGGWRGYLLDPPPAHCRWFIALAVTLGVLYRCAQYMANRAFWRDESSLLLNILDKGPRELMGRLDYMQTGPVLFLWAERAMALSFGPSEWVMRLLPLAAGIVALALFAVMAWRVVGPAAAVLATAWFAFCSDLVWHAVCLKTVQRRRDGGDTAGLPVHRLAAESIATKSASWSSRSVSAVGIWYSQPAILLFAGISLALLPGLWARGRRGLAAWLAGNAVVGASFAAMVLVLIALPARPGTAELLAGRHGRLVASLDDPRDADQRNLGPSANCRTRRSAPSRSCWR